MKPTIDLYWLGITQSRSVAGSLAFEHTLGFENLRGWWARDRRLSAGMNVVREIQVDSPCVYRNALPPNTCFVQRINEKEVWASLDGKTSWHEQYAQSAYIFVGGLGYNLTEGDVLCIFSQ